jgi:NAD(P)-dependent dehydrogenase (short-subunit alcohol dehydrogenase family)
MDLGLSGRRALITGASRGIGRAIAEAFAREGCHLCLCARDSVALATAKRELESQYAVDVSLHPCDLADTNSAELLANECGNVDVLVNNAGAIPRGSILEIDDATWREAWNLKVFGYINLTRAFYSRMSIRESGVIINIIGIGAEKLDAAYAAGSSGNAALVALTKALGSVSLDQGVRVVGVNPGWVETDKAKRSLQKRAAEELDDSNRWPELVADWPRGSLIKPSEIGDVVAFLASERASALCGTVVTIDAGFSARGYGQSKSKTSSKIASP